MVLNLVLLECVNLEIRPLVSETVRYIVVLVKLRPDYT